MVVLLAMGGYGALSLGWQIRTSEDTEVLAKARDMHPKVSVDQAGQGWGGAHANWLSAHHKFIPMNSLLISPRSLSPLMLSAGRRHVLLLCARSCWRDDVAPHAGQAHF
jgi:hypothetical protein